MILWTFPFVPGSFTENFKLLSRPGGRNPIHGSLQRARHAALLDTAPNFPCCLWNHNKPELRMSGTFLNTVHVISYNHSQWLYGAGTGISSGDGNWGREVKALPDSAVACLVYHPKQSGYHAATLRFEEHSKDGSQLRARCLAKAASWYSVEFISVQGLREEVRTFTEVHPSLSGTIHWPWASHSQTTSSQIIWHPYDHQQAWCREQNLPIGSQQLGSYPLSKWPHSGNLKK